MYCKWCCGQRRSSLNGSSMQRMQPEQDVRTTYVEVAF